MTDVVSSWVVYYPSNNGACGMHLHSAERVLRNPIKPVYDDINEVLELYSIKKYIDNHVFLNAWSPQDITDFQCRVASYNGVVGKFVAHINDANIQSFFNDTVRSYEATFWELCSAHSVTKRISASVFEELLLQRPYLINLFLTHANMVSKYQLILRKFLLEYPKSAELLLSIYGVKDSSNQYAMSLPKSLTTADKELIISNYLDSPESDFHSVRLIQQMRNQKEFYITDKVRLRAKRLYLKKVEYLQANAGLNHNAFGVSVGFQANAASLVNCSIKNGVEQCIYNLNHLKNNSDPYSLFLNFKYLFGYLDNQNRIRLVSNVKDLGLFERMSVVSSQHEYIQGVSFLVSEMKSQAQVIVYNKEINNLDTTLEDIISYIFEKSFQEKHGFADNATFSTSTATTYLQKIRVLAPEFESALKQFKLFVEDGHIDFELLQISSAPSSIKDIPSLNDKKYYYLSEGNEAIINCLYSFFSDQSILCNVDPNQDEHYKSFFDLLKNEDVKYGSYEEYKRDTLDFLIAQGLIEIDENDFIIVSNPERLLLLRDLHDHDVGSFYNFELEVQQEIERMAAENIIYFESSLFSKPEQSYFNYYLNKKEFTNGLDLRNSYIHGTQTQDVKEHESDYFSYLKLIFLTLLKMEDDLAIYRSINNVNPHS